jgi:hypothetical protein
VSTLAERWPYLLLVLAMWILIRWGMPMSTWVRRRRRGDSIERHNKERGDK